RAVELRQGSHSPPVRPFIAVPPKAHEPAEHTRNGPRADVKRTVRTQHPPDRLRNEPRCRYRCGQRRCDPASIAFRGAASKLTLVEDDYRPSTPSQFIRRQKSDDSSA